MTLVEIARAGEMARIGGHTQLQNPYCQTKNMPGCTGEDFHTWQQKVIAWNFGWDNGNAPPSRPNRRSTSA